MAKELKKFDFIIGNPPYNNGKSQIYTDFYLSGREIGNCVEMIFPTGWQEPKMANNLSKLNKKEIKEDKQIVFIDNKQNVFPGITGAEWTNVIMWKKDYDNGLNGSQKLLTNGKDTQINKLLYDKTDIKIPETLSNIVIKTKENNFKSIDTIIYIQNNLILENIYKEFPETKKLIGSNGKDKRFERNIFEKIPAFVDNKENDDDIYTIGTSGNVRTWKYINKKYVDCSHKNLYKYKLIISAAASDEFGSKLSDFVIGTPGIAYTRSFISFGSCDNETEVKNIEKYLKTKFSRALLYSLKFGRMNNKNVWGNVPLQNFTDKSDINWSKSIKEIDQQLYKKYGLSEDEINFIEEKVKEMN